MWALRAVMVLGLVAVGMAGCEMEDPPPYDNGGGDDDGDGDGDGTIQTAGTCPNATLDDFREYDSSDGPPPGWASHAPPYSIQTTAFCARACLGAYEYGERSSEVQTYCRLMFSVSPQVQGSWCPVCAPFKP